jgi:uncharacterized protein
MTTTFRANEIPTAELTESLLGEPTATPLDGDIVVRKQGFFSSDDGRILSGTWESEPGVSRWEFLTRGEIIYVLSGSMTVQRDGEEPVKLAAGASAIFPLGWAGTWTVHETMRKVYVIYTK